MEDSNSFVAEIDNRHLYLGNTQSNQYAVVVDWQLPENQIETFSLSEGDLTYTEFADSFRSSSNYRGNLTWAELSESGEIDLARLGLSPEAIDNDFNTISARSLELSSGESNENPSEEDTIATDPPTDDNLSESPISVEEYNITQLTDNDVDDSNLRVSEGNIVWSANDGNDDEIFFYDGNSVSQLTDNEVFETDPQISGNNIIWWQTPTDSSDNPLGGGEIIFYDGTTTTTIARLRNAVFHVIS
ncbi:MAG: hypothetical protein ACFCAD_01575 [Pleurocapsa sp.]